MTLADRLAATDVAELAVRVQQIPAPTFAEHARARFVDGAFAECGLEHWLVEHADDVPNAYARIPGRNPRLPALLVSAHTDTVFAATTDLTARRDPTARTIHGPGIGDNSLAVAALIALARATAAEPVAAGAAGGGADGGPGDGSAVPGDRRSEPPFPCDLWLVANSAEEGLGDLRGIRAALEWIGGRAPAGIGAGVVLEGLALGSVYHRGVGSTRFRVTVDAPGGHSWGDFGRASAIHELIRRLAPVVEMNVSEDPRTTFNVGVVSGGTTVNTIAAAAEALIDLRSESPAELEHLVQRVRGAVRPGSDGQVRVAMERIGHREAGEIAADHPLVAAALGALAEAGLPGELRAGSTDLNALLAAGIPGVCLGISTGAGAHRLDEYINTGPVPQGMAQLALLLPRAARIASGEDL